MDLFEKSAFKQKFTIGLLGILLPIMTISSCLFFGEHKIPRSISASYYTNSMPILEVSLGILGVVFITYSNKNLFYSIIHWLIGISAIGIAIFPTYVESFAGPVGIFDLMGATSGIFHQIFTGIFFVLIAFTMVFLLANCFETKFSFPRHHDKYYFASGIIEAFLLLVLAFGIIFDLNSYFHEFIFLLEVLLLWNFGICFMINSWDIYHQSQPQKNVSDEIS
ncbi:MAG: hypothetical protein LBV55_02570 [Acholeplasmatales bacterium]|jgi:hypothetical protein|nr:hypothetical protein [Acholeplasmatales bacterium]